MSPYSSLEWSAVDQLASQDFFGSSPGPSWSDDVAGEEEAMPLQGPRRKRDLEVEEDPGRKERKVEEGAGGGAGLLDALVQGLSDASVTPEQESEAAFWPVQGGVEVPGGGTTADEEEAAAGQRRTPGGRASRLPVAASRGESVERARTSAPGGLRGRGRASGASREPPLSWQ